MLHALLTRVFGSAEEVNGGCATRMEHLRYVFRPGQRATWVHLPRGGYGFVVLVPVRLVSVSGSRATVEAALANGQTVKRSVAIENLREASHG